MEQKWKKRYSFRLKKEDQELSEFLEEIPESKRSEAIRHLLVFACRTMSEEKQQAQHRGQLLNELAFIRKTLENHQNLLVQLTAKQAVPVEKKESPQETLTDQAMTDSAAAMISSFGLTL